MLGGPPWPLIPSSGGDNQSPRKNMSTLTMRLRPSRLDVVCEYAKSHIAKLCSLRGRVRARLESMTKGDQSVLSKARGTHQANGGRGGNGDGPKRPGRKPGKHSNENYTQTSIYLPIELRNRVRARLYERGMEMSGLVEDMLRDWLTKELGA